MINFIIQTVIQFADLFNQLQDTLKTMQSQPLNPQVSRINLVQLKRTERKRSCSLIKQNESHNKNFYITPIKRPIICTQSIFNPKTIKKHYSSDQFYPYQDKFFRISRFDHVKINRARIIDWFIEICKQCNQSWNTFWMTVQLLDRLIADVNCVKVSNIHICGTVVFFISSKYVEVQPLTLQKIENDILYRKYSRAQILKCQQFILSKLVFDLKNSSSLHFPTVYEKVLELCQQTNQMFIKCVFRELAYVYMAPQMALFENNKRIREKTLIKQVCDALMNSQRFEKAGDVQQYFLENYGCLNVRRLSKAIRI